ncbi:WD repeat-containing protein 55 homolog [Galleria mellonella]|uniref:WD repeat-containing protein 55 homolog n=1 Tax=Galleria mellonella TaxID=7137 RepID=A0ABM3MZX1_GALME|nr:WD repeat-containing protein 55 homolog [Galleria mellonella]
MAINFRDYDKNSSDESDSDISDGTNEESSENDSMDYEDDNVDEPTLNEQNTNQNNAEDDSDEDEEEDEVVKAIKAEKNKPRDHPPTITSEDFIVDISFSPIKNLIAIANIVGDILLYEYSNDETKLVNTLELHLKACRQVEFDNNGLTVYSTAKDKVIMATDVETGKLKQCYENAHEEPVYSLKCLDNGKIVTGDDGGTVKLWDMRKPDPIFNLKISEEYVSDMITNEAQKYLVCAGGDGVLTSIDLKASKIYTTSEDYDSELTCMGLFRSETKLLVGSSKGKLYLFNWKEFGLHSDEYIGQKHSIQCMIPITQNVVVTSGEDGVLRATHMFPQRHLGIVGQHRLPVECLDISHDGQYIASSSHDNDVKFWNISYFETIDSIINVNHKQNKKKDLVNNLPSSSIKNASDFFSGLV